MLQRNKIVFATKGERVQWVQPARPV